MLFEVNAVLATLESLHADSYWNLLSSSLPYPYVYLVGFMVKLSMLSMAVSKAPRLAVYMRIIRDASSDVFAKVADEFVVDADDVRIANETLVGVESQVVYDEHDNFRAIAAMAVTCGLLLLINFVYQGLMDLQATLSNPSLGTSLGHIITDRLIRHAC